MTESFPIGVAVGSSHVDCKVTTKVSPPVSLSLALLSSLHVVSLQWRGNWIRAESFILKSKPKLSDAFSVHQSCSTCIHTPTTHTYTYYTQQTALSMVLTLDPWTGYTSNDAQIMPTQRWDLQVFIHQTLIISQHKLIYASLLINNTAQQKIAINNVCLPFSLSVENRPQNIHRARGHLIPASYFTPLA